MVTVPNEVAKGCVPCQERLPRDVCLAKGVCQGMGALPRETAKGCVKGIGQGMGQGRLPRDGSRETAKGWETDKTKGDCQRMDCSKGGVQREPCQCILGQAVGSKVASESC